MLLLVIDLVLQIVVKGRTFRWLCRWLPESSHFISASLFLHGHLSSISSLDQIRRVQVWIRLLLLLMILNVALICALGSRDDLVSLLIWICLLLLHDLNLWLVGLRVSFIHEYSAVFLIPQSHYACFVVYHIEEFVDYLLILNLNILRYVWIKSLFTVNSQTSFAFSWCIDVRVPCLLLLYTVDLVNESLFHLRRDWHMNMHNIAILLIWLTLNYLVIVHHWASIWVWDFLPFSDCLDQLVSYLILKFCICHHWQVVESTWWNSHAFKLLSGICVDWKRQLDLIRIMNLWLDLHRVATFLTRFVVWYDLCFARLCWLHRVLDMSIHSLTLHRPTINWHSGIPVGNLVWNVLRYYQTLHAWCHRVPACSLRSHFMKSFIFGKRIRLLDTAALILLDALGGVLERLVCNSNLVATKRPLLSSKFGILFNWKSPTAPILHTRIADCVLHRVIEIWAYPSLISFNKIVRISLCLFW